MPTDSVQISAETADYPSVFTLSFFYSKRIPDFWLGTTDKKCISRPSHADRCSSVIKYRPMGFKWNLGVQLLGSALN